MDEARIAEIVDRVIDRLDARGAVPPAPPVPSAATPEQRAAAGPSGHLGVFEDPDDAVRAAEKAFHVAQRGSLELRRLMVEAIRRTGREHLRELSRRAVDETGLGRVDDKLAKNTLAIDKTPGVECLRPDAATGDDGLTLTERAAYGVILSVTPCTNPTETILCNAIGMIAGGNAVVFNVHPAARGVCNWLIDRLNHAIDAVGGPRHLIASVAQPTVESAQRLMAHPAIRLVVVTGGPAVVKTAMASGKKVIAAGPGNPPVVVDDSADLGRAADAIVRGASIDNNIICTAEKEIVAVDAIADKLWVELDRRATLRLGSHQVRLLERLILDGDHVDKAWVGKDAGQLAAAIGIGGTDPELRLLTCEVDEGHPFVQHELLMPVIGLVRATDATDAIAIAKRVEHDFHHTAVMHSTHIERMAAMARVCNASIFVKNASNLAGLGLGGEGYTSFTIASPTGEGMTRARHFTRERRCTLKDAFRFV